MKDVPENLLEIYAFTRSFPAEKIQESSGRSGKLPSHPGSWLLGPLLSNLV